MSSEKKVMLLTMLLLTFTIFGFTTMQSDSSVRTDVKVYVWNPATASNVYPALAYPTPTTVEVWIDTPDEWDNTSNGIVGVTVSLRVDPTVVEVLTAQQWPDTDFDGTSNGFLGDFLSRHGYNFMGYTTAFLIGSVDKTAGTINETAEAILGFSTLGVGAGGGPIGLFRYVIRTQSGVDHTTAYSPITLMEAYYTTVDSEKHPIDIVESGHYGTPVETYDLTVAVDGAGTTDPAPGVHTYPADTEVSVTAIPVSCYVLDHWELDGVDVGDANPYAVIMDADHALTAFFTQAPVTIDELRDLATMFFEEGKISHKGMYNSLIVKLNAAEAYLEAGRFDEAKSVLGAFINHVRAQSGKHVSEDAANTLITEAEKLINSI